MTFFNETAANDIQFVSMFLEIIGITLAYIEFRYKPLAHIIEAKIISGEGRIRDFAYGIIENKLFVWLITIFIVVVFFVVIPDMAGFYDRVFPFEWHFLRAIIFWLTFPIVVLFGVGIGFILFAEFVVWLNQFSDGHAIGALGVIVTILGLIGESYQVCTILFGK